MKRVVYATFGEPSKVLRIVDGPPLEPEPDGVVIAVESAPIHLADLKSIRGEPWFRHVTLPAVPGYEGVGRVRAVGTDVSSVKVGQRVFLPVGFGCWCEEVKARAADLWIAPEHLPAEQLALVPINLLTAYLLITACVRLDTGSWVIQNAANSNVGHYLIRIARRLGLHTVNVVRRESAIAGVRDAGGDVTVVDGADLAARVRAVIGTRALGLGIDAVAGEATTRIAECLNGPSATVVCYGFASGEPCSLPAQHLLFDGIELTGFYLKRTLARLSAAEVAAVHSWTDRFLAEESPNAPIAAIYDLAEVHAAVDHAARVGEHRTGKVVLAVSRGDSRAEG
jgi:mitochondrial enoyl-[acyl-carrier protein] reductase / trans-2-enoyl-CoA reductase